MDAFSDLNWVTSSVQFAKDLANSKSKLSAFRSPLGRHYLYLFNHYPAYKAGQPELRGTSHGEDVSYAFDPVPEFGSRQGFTSDDYMVGSTFRTLLSSFTKTGWVDVEICGSLSNLSVVLA